MTGVWRPLNEAKDWIGVLRAAEAVDRTDEHTPRHHAADHAQTGVKESWTADIGTRGEAS